MVPAFSLPGSQNTLYPTPHLTTPTQVLTSIPALGATTVVQPQVFCSQSNAKTAISVTELEADGEIDNKNAAEEHPAVTPKSESNNASLNDSTCSSEQATPTKTLPHDPVADLINTMFIKRLSPQRCRKPTRQRVRRNHPSPPALLPPAPLCMAPPNVGLLSRPLHPNYMPSGLVHGGHMY